MNCLVSWSADRSSNMPKIFGRKVRAACWIMCCGECVIRCEARHATASHFAPGSNCATSSAAPSTLRHAAPPPAHGGRLWHTWFNTSCLSQSKPPRIYPPGIPPFSISHMAGQWCFKCSTTIPTHPTLPYLYEALSLWNTKSSLSGTQSRSDKDNKNSESDNLGKNVFSGKFESYSD